jgi:hypothetical protein
MLKKDFKEYICNPFCTYFHENSKEDLACRGALVVIELLRQGRLDINMLPELNRDIISWGKHDADLDAAVCRRCSFREEDCDFQSEENKYNANPCGGYRLLNLLKMTGFNITADFEEKND